MRGVWGAVELGEGMCEESVREKSERIGSFWFVFVCLSNVVQC